jgi:hypothetical protein
MPFTRVSQLHHRSRVNLWNYRPCVCLFLYYFTGFMQVAHMGDIFPISTIIGCYIPEIPKNDLKIRDQQLYFLKRNIQATETH